MHYLDGSHGLNENPREIMMGELNEDQCLAGVYSIGGGNSGILAFDAAGRQPTVFIGHDLNDDNLTLLRTGRIDALLRQDLNRCCRILMHDHGALSNEPPIEASKILPYTTSRSACSSRSHGLIPQDPQAHNP
ncbi:hypothetical protein [Arthrobacter sp. VKM Ac-2550]|uniref:hypothetical protein n=1 Tax=Crystallibacter permensis TaxID=1938888 RepID=UPI002226E50F|nr:hypothetical protein [Arthrobacter sp. VKM Ac-2550]